MELKTERKDGALVAWVNERIDGANVLEFEEAVRSAIEDDDRAVVMDFENLTYISSAGLRAVLLTAKTLWDRDAKFALCSVSPSIREIFEISGFDKIITIHATQEEALAAFAAG